MLDSQWTPPGIWQDALEKSEMSEINIRGISGPHLGPAIEICMFYRILQCYLCHAHDLHNVDAGRYSLLACIHNTLQWLSPSNG